MWCRNVKIQTQTSCLPKPTLEYMPNALIKLGHNLGCNGNHGLGGYSAGHWVPYKMPENAILRCRH